MCQDIQDMVASQHRSWLMHSNSFRLAVSPFCCAALCKLQLIEFKLQMHSSCRRTSCKPEAATETKTGSQEHGAINRKLQQLLSIAGVACLQMG